MHTEASRAQDNGIVNVRLSSLEDEHVDVRILGKACSKRQARGLHQGHQPADDSPAHNNTHASTHDDIVKHPPMHRLCGDDHPSLQ